MSLDLFILTPLINLEDRELCYFPNNRLQYNICIATHIQQSLKYNTHCNTLPTHFTLSCNKILSIARYFQPFKPPLRSRYNTCIVIMLMLKWAVAHSFTAPNIFFFRFSFFFFSHLFQPLENKNIHLYFFFHFP